MIAWLKAKLGTEDEEGWSIKTKHFVFHPLSYGIATLSRVGIRTEPGGWALMLHHFRAHRETEFHDHPWRFRTFVLWGYYIDESIGPDQEIVREVMWMGKTKARDALHAHRTTCLRHTWTLVLMWPKSRAWCKGTPDRWVCGGNVEDFDATRGMVKVGTD